MRPLLQLVSQASLWMPGPGWAAEAGGWLALLFYSKLLPARAPTPEKELSQVPGQSQVGRSISPGNLSLSWWPGPSALWVAWKGVGRAGMEGQTIVRVRSSSSWTLALAMIFICVPSLSPPGQSGSRVKIKSISQSVLIPSFQALCLLEGILRLTRHEASLQGYWIYCRCGVQACMHVHINSHVLMGGSLGYQ